MFAGYVDYHARVTSNRVRRALFPEFANDGEVNGHNGHGESSLIQLFAEPSQDFRDAVVDLINLRDDIEDMARNLPELIRLLGDSDPVCTQGKTSTKEREI